MYPLYLDKLYMVSSGSSDRSFRVVKGVCHFHPGKVYFDIRSVVAHTVGHNLEVLQSMLASL